MPGDIVAITANVVATASSPFFAINVGGTLTFPQWPAGYIPSSGDVVNVLQVSNRLFVLGPVSTSPRPISGTVSGAASSGLIPVDVTIGPTPLQCRYTGTAPSVGTLVFLDWQATTPRIFSGAAATVPAAPAPDPIAPAPPPDKPAAPPPPKTVKQTGTTAFTAVDAASYRPGYGRWDTGEVKQWKYSSESESRGAWFYGNGPTQIKGRTVTAAQLFLPARLHIGSYNATLTTHLYLASNRYRPGGDTTRTAGPFDLNIPAGWPGYWVNIPASWGQTLANSGGSIAIVGSPYMGFVGLGSTVASGQLRLTWTR